MPSWKTARPVWPMPSAGTSVARWTKSGAAPSPGRCARRSRGAGRRSRLPDRRGPGRAPCSLPRASHHVPRSCATSIRKGRYEWSSAARGDRRHPLVPTSDRSPPVPLPIHPVLFGVRPRGGRPARCIAGDRVGGEAHRALPPVRRLRLRPGTAGPRPGRPVPMNPLEPFEIAIGWLLAVFYSVVPNLGFAIILLTCAVMALLLPLTAKQTRSMIAMRRVQPEIKKLQAQYKDDRQKQNEALMEFYKENNVNPLSGCLPLIVQMPVLFALFQVLRNVQDHIPTTGVFNDLFRDLCGNAATAAACSNPKDMYFLGLKARIGRRRDHSSHRSHAPSKSAWPANSRSAPGQYRSRRSPQQCSSTRGLPVEMNANALEPPASSSAARSRLRPSSSRYPHVAVSGRRPSARRRAGRRAPRAAARRNRRARLPVGQRAARRSPGPAARAVRPGRPRRSSAAAERRPRS